MEPRKGATIRMALNKADIRVIYICCKILETSLPYEDEIFEIVEKCRSALGNDAIRSLDAEVREYLTDGSLKSLCSKIE